MMSAFYLWQTVGGPETIPGKFSHPTDNPTLLAHFLLELVRRVARGAGRR